MMNAVKFKMIMETITIMMIDIKMEILDLKILLT